MRRRYHAHVFITFEGPEESGKSTLISGLAEAPHHRFEIVAGEIGKHIREILLQGKALDPKTEIFLFMADRSQHVATVVRPALPRCACVLCDRHADSTLVYQGYGRGIDLDLLRRWNRFATPGIDPDLTFLLYRDHAIGLARIVSKDRPDAESIEFHTKVCAGFLAEAGFDPKRWTVLDASGSAVAVYNRALSAMRAGLANSVSASGG